jgi:tetratricopeptide (TPR) repeat protein
VPAVVHQASIFVAGAFLAIAAPATLDTAKQQLAAQRFNEALATVEEILKAAPNDVYALKLKADTEYLLARDAHAEKTLLRALAIDPNFEEAVYALGRVYSQQSRYPEAIRQFEKVLILQPKSYKAYDNLGLCYEHMNDPQRAIQHYLKAISIVHKDVPGYDWPYANLANLLISQGELKQAFNLAVEAAERNPGSARNYYLAGKALNRLNQEKKSLRWLHRSIELDPEYPEPHYLLAQTLQKQGKTAEAGHEFARFKELRAKVPSKLR